MARRTALDRPTWATAPLAIALGLATLGPIACSSAEAERAGPGLGADAGSGLDAAGAADGGGATDAGGCIGADCNTDGGSQVPPRRCDVKDFGAVGNGTTLDTKAIQAAIDECAKTGGTVSMQGGTFLSGMITLKSKVNLDIAAGATLLGSTNAADYPDVNPPITNTQLGNCRKALVYAEGVDGVHVEGGGTIDGNARKVPDWNGNKIKEALRPMAIFTTISKNVTIQNLRVKDAATWAVVHMEVDGLTVRRLDVDTNLGPTHDGIDVVDGHSVLIEDCTVTSGDDSICLKSGSAKGTEGVLVRRSRTRQSGVANGVKFGTASVGSFKNIVVEDVDVANAQAAGLAVESVDGAHIANVTFRRITVDNVGTPFFVLLGSRDLDPTRVGSIDGLTFDGISGKNMRYGWGSIVTGSIVDTRTFLINNIAFKNIDITFKGDGTPPNPSPFTDDNFPEYQGPVPGQPGKRYNRYPDAKFFAGFDGNENITYHGPGYAIFLRHARNVTFESCNARLSAADSRLWMDTKDTAGVSGKCVP